MEAIKEFRGETRWLSNFHVAPIDALGLTFRTTEAAYQAHKRIDDKDFHLKIQEFRWAGEAMRYARSLPILTPHWHESTKLVVMFELNLQKFTRHPELRELLIATGDAHLEEGNYWGDTFWGTENGEGHNHLGKTLMAVRSRLMLTE